MLMSYNQKFLSKNNPLFIAVYSCFKQSLGIVMEARILAETKIENCGKNIFFMGKRILIRILFL